MIWLVLLAFLPATPPVEVTFVVREPLPASAEIVRLARFPAGGPWQIADVRQVPVHSGRFAVPGPPGVDSLILLRVAGHPGYLLHGPLRWPAEPASLDMDPQWRRTVRGQHPSSGGLAWISGMRGSARVECEWILLDRWQCLGIPRSTAGVVVRAGPTRIFYSVVGALGPRNEVEDVATASAAWGRLLVVRNARSAGQGGAPVRVRALRVYRAPSRPNTTRLEVATDGRIHVNPIGPTALWVTGDAGVEGSWLELIVPEIGAGRVNVAELAAGATDDVLDVALERPIAVFGRVTGPLAAPAERAIVSLYRFGEEVRTPNRKKMQRERIAVGEQRTDANGAFAFPDLPPERYELLAVHSEYGRAVRIVEPHESEVQLALKRPPILAGRVLRQGVPQSGIAVAFMPDLAAFAAAEDPTELRGGEGETNADGWFRITAPTAGTGELKIGSAPGPFKRVPLPPADALPPESLLGDIELDAGPAVTLVFEEAGECQPILTGPIGRTGLTVVRTVRAGPAMFNATLPESGRWNVVAICGRRERPVVPAVIEIGPADRETTWSLRWP